MKLFLFALSLTALNVAAQTKFLPHKNTEWHYRFNSTFGPAVYNESLKYVNDSIIGTDTVKVLYHTRHFTTCEAPASQMTFFKQKNDSVFFKNNITFNQWQLLINYGAQPGQTWNFTVKNNDNSPQTYTVTVNTLTTSIVNSMNLKVLNVSYSGQFSPGPSNIYERFGDTHFLFNFADKFSAMATCTVSAGILCYQDSTFGFKQFTGDPCTYSTTAVNEQELEEEKMTIYPNPTTGRLFINSDKTFAEEIKIINVVGQEVYFIKNKNEIDITSLKAGVYFLQLHQQNQLIQTIKLVKE